MGNERVVWLVDDSPMEAELARRVLCKDYKVEVFAEAVSMLERIASGERPTVLVLDVELPGVTGLDACRFLRARESLQRLPILMLTVRGQKASVVEGLAAGANDYVPKPFDSAELTARVAALVRAEELFERAEAAERAREDARAQALADRERLRALFTHSPAGVCVLVGRDHICEFVNPEYSRLIGGRAVLGKPIRAALPDLEGQGLFELLDRVYATGETHVAQAAPVPLQAPVAGALESFVKVTYQPSRNLRGEVVGVDIYTFDVTDQVVGRRKLEELLSLAAHELRTPMTSFHLQVQILLKALEREPSALGPERLKRSLEMLDRQIRRQGRLVDELLDLSRLAAGKLQIEQEEIDVAQLVSEVAARFEEELKRSGSSILLKSSGTVTASVDRLRLDQVVTNLLSNALKYGRGKPIEVVTLEVGTRRLRLVVRDRGIGIGPQDLGRVFDRFERAVSERHYSGLGLGLWITRRIVEALGGTISVESELGVGSTFTVELPRSQDAVQFSESVERG